ncbi:rhodanese-like domain-containing protein [Chitinophaga sp. 30R24]|uniref:rhodanese-like domain-containing protein n=1 Tax=Chitinophaga sp. 30R24 TaxID=3248838 RepID=UPI003B8F2492
MEIVAVQTCVADFKAHPDNYTIVDVRMENETQARIVFDQALAIPLDQLRQRVNEIPLDKPVVVHCVGGYRSAAGISIVANALNGKVAVYDLGEAVKQF